MTEVDKIISLYRTFIRSNKWTLRMNCHVFDVAVANSWLRYKNYVEKLMVSKKNQFDLINFTIDLALDLVNVGKASPTRRGRLSATESLCTTPTSSKIN